MSKQGFILLHRKIMDNPYYFSEPFTRCQAWIDLLLLANHKVGFFYKRGIRVDVKRGQIGFDTTSLSERWKWSRGKVNRFLNELETDMQIVQQKTNVTTLISISNYDIYQANGTADSTANDTTNSTANDLPNDLPNGQQTDTNNNEKNNNNVNNVKNSLSIPPANLKEGEVNLIFKLSKEELLTELYNNHSYITNLQTNHRWLKSENHVKTLMNEFCSLLTDSDSYPITYKEATNRFSGFIRKRNIETVELKSNNTVRL